MVTVISFQPWCSHLKSPYLPPDLTGAACSEIITLEQNQGVCRDWLFPPIYQKDQGRILGIALVLHKLVISPDPWKLGGKALTSGHGSPEADSTSSLSPPPTVFLASSVSSYVQQWLFFCYTTPETSERIRTGLWIHMDLKPEAQPHFPGAVRL